MNFLGIRSRKITTPMYYNIVHAANLLGYTPPPKPKGVRPKPKEKLVLAGDEGGGPYDDEFVETVPEPETDLCELLGIGENSSL